MELENRPALEAKFGKRLQALSNRHRKELIALLGNPPDFNAVTPAFWQRVKRETEEEAAALLLLLFMSSAETHVKKGGGDLSIVQPVILQQAETFATKRAAEVGLRVAVGASMRFDNVRKDIEAESDLREPTTATKAEVLDRAGPVFSPSQTIQTTRDETTRARHVGGEAGVKVTTGISEFDLWQNRPSMSRTGPCPQCAPLHNTYRSIWSLVYPQGPPQPHVGCVCVIQYAFERE